MTWVKTRLELEDLAPGSELLVRVRTGESHHNVATNCRSEGHTVLDDRTDDLDTGARVLRIRRAS